MGRGEDQGGIPYSHGGGKEVEHLELEDTGLITM